MHRALVSSDVLGSGLAAFLAAVLSIAVAVPAAAADGLFVSVKYGDTDVEVELFDSFDTVVDGEENSRGFELGYGFLGWFAIQAGYHDLGSFEPFVTCPECLVSDSELTAPLGLETEAFSLSAKAEVTVLPLLSVFGKVGVARVETELATQIGDVTTKIVETSEEETLIGAGLRLKLIPSRLSLFGEWERIGSDIETASLGATLHF